MLSRLSRLVPVRFSTSYLAAEGPYTRHERATWWQWRDRIFRHHRRPVGA